MKLSTTDRSRQALADFVYVDHYIEMYPDVASAQIEPARHYFEYGLHEDRSPNPLFDPSFYKKQLREALAIPALVHYLKVGAIAGLKSHPLFDRNYYLQQYPEVAKVGIDPLFFF